MWLIINTRRRIRPPLNMAQTLGFYVKQTYTTCLWQLFKIRRYRCTLGGRVLLWTKLNIQKAVVIWNFMRHNQSQTSACLSINNKTMNFEGGFVLLWIWLTWILYQTKMQNFSCHFLKIYMKISLNARRASPPLSIAQTSKVSRHWNFIFQYDRRIASSLLSNF